MSLSKADLEHFAFYRIPESLLVAAKVTRVTDAEARGSEHLIEWQNYSDDLGGLVYPYHDPLSGLYVTCRLRPDVAPTNKDGEPVKYITPRHGKRPRRLYHAPGAGLLLKDTTVPVVFVESEKSVLACTAAAERAQRRILFVATGGVYGWLTRSGKDGESRPVYDFNYFEWKEREAIIMFDHDAQDKPEVRAARRRLAVFLSGCDAIVKIAEIPEVNCVRL